jgi:hypothetical protein
MFDVKTYDVANNETETIRGLNLAQLISLEMLLHRLGVRYKIVKVEK